MRFKKWIYALLPALLCYACKSPSSGQADSANQFKDDTLVKYARRFSMEVDGDALVLKIFGNRHNQEATSMFVLAKDTSGLIRNYRFREARIMQVPCRKIAALSSIYANMFCELGELHNLVAIDNIDYIINPEIMDKHKKGELAEIAKTDRVNIEAALNLQPGIIFTFGMGEGEKDVDKKLSQTDIPVAISVDHLEESPLARAEWIKFFAAFAGKMTVADSIFRQVEKNYLRYKKFLSAVKERPTVFSEVKYGEFWYMPGGKSYVAALFADAGADYLWKDNPEFGSQPLSFEQVYAKARNADYWLNISTCADKQCVSNLEKRNSGFKAFKNGNLFNNNKIVNKGGYCTYWETGMIFPDRILSDLGQIFHPGLKDSLRNDLYYYKRLE